MAAPTTGSTPLAAKIIARIRRDGPITVAQFMRLCLQDAEHGYYRTKAAIGRSGDFITAPEISQVFGELIGLWCAVVWQQMGQPTHFHLVELGPGRGTMMNDALRAARIVPGFVGAAEIVLVETNDKLRDAQRQTLSQTAVPIRWVSSMAEAAIGGDAIYLGNEFIDALDVEQFVWDGDAWRERLLGLDADGRLSFRDDGPQVKQDLRFEGARTVGDVLEWRHPFVRDTLKGTRVAALFLDYGHDATALGDTLQAVRKHRYEGIFDTPGEGDLTTQVDFAAVAREAEDLGYEVDGSVPQGEFLGALGILERTSRLMAANPARAGEIEAGTARLLAPTGMGGRFKALGIRSRSLPPLPGLVHIDRA